MKNYVAIICLALFSPLFLAAADKKPQDLLIGKWLPADEKDKGVDLEFASGGVLKIDYKVDGMSFIFNGAYKVLDDKTLEVATDDLAKKGEKKTEKLAIKSLTGDAIVFVDGKGIERTLKRDKPAPPAFPKQGGLPPGFNPGMFNPGMNQ